MGVRREERITMSVGDFWRIAERPLRRTGVVILRGLKIGTSSEREMREMNGKERRGEIQLRVKWFTTLSPFCYLKPRVGSSGGEIRVMS